MKNINEPCTYKIIHREELIGWFYVEADSEEEALEEFQRQCSRGGN